MTRNIKDPEAHKLAMALQRETGQTMARALRGSAVDHGKMLYDERGLPR